MGRTSAKAAAAAAPAAAAPSSHKQKQKQQTGCCSRGSDCNEAHHSHDNSHGHSHDGHSHAAAAASSSSAGGAASSASVPYRCAVSKSMGRSLVATRAIKAGEMILREWPAAMLHFRHNARQVLACAACGRFVGTLMDQLNALMRASAADECTSLPVLAVEDCELCPLVRCTHAGAGCAEVYCSEAHRARSWKRGHRLLCVGAPVDSDAAAPASSHAAATVASAADAAASKGSHKRAKLESKAGGAAAAAAAAPSTSARASSSSSASAAGSSAAGSSHPFAQFVAHAEQQHEFFIAAAHIAAQIVCAIEDGMPEAEAVAPFAAYVQRPWWEIVAPVSADRSDSAGAAAAAAGQKRKRAADSDDDDDDEDENESVAAHLRTVVGHSYSLLRAALFERRSKPAMAFFTAQWYASTVGALRLNALAVEHPSPLRDYAEVVDRRLRDLEAEAKAQAAANKASDSMSDEDEDEGEDGGAEDGDGQSDGDSSSSSDEDDDDEEEDEENGDDDGGCERRRLRLAAAAAADSATDQRRAILLHLLPLLSRAMRVRLEDKIARKRSRTAARLAALAAEESGADADADAASGHQAAHARVRKVDRDSYPTQSYGWQLRYSRRHAQRLLFSTRLFPSMHASALYPTVAQANHCCAPNASVEHGQDAEARLHATRDISAGEQIFLSYINEEQSKTERRSDLRDYGFVCQCVRCQAEESDQDEDDADDADDGEGED